MFFFGERTEIFKRLGPMPPYGAGITEKRHSRRVTTDLRDGGQGGAGITEKRHAGS